jgi:glutathione S-transferase
LEEHSREFQHKKDVYYPGGIMKLYFYPSACSFVVRIILNELGLAFQDDKVDLRERKTEDGRDFLTVNPKGGVPALQLDNGKVITEVQVILQYLADSNNAYQLLPAVGQLERYTTLEWMNYVSTELHKSIGLFFLPTLSEEMKATVLQPLIARRLKFINDQLSKGTYLLGDHFTLPDAYLFVMLQWAKYHKIDLSSYPKLIAYEEQLSQRPSIVKSREQEKSR